MNLVIHDLARNMSTSCQPHTTPLCMPSFHYAKYDDNDLVYPSHIITVGRSEHGYEALMTNYACLFREFPLRHWAWLVRSAVRQELSRSTKSLRDLRFAKYFQICRLLRSDLLADLKRKHVDTSCSKPHGRRSPPADRLSVSGSEPLLSHRQAKKI